MLRAIERFLRETGMSGTQFGRRAAGDPRFVADLRNGRQPRPTTISRIEHFMNRFREEACAD